MSGSEFPNEWAVGDAIVRLDRREGARFELRVSEDDGERLIEGRVISHNGIEQYIPDDEDNLDFLSEIFAILSEDAHGV